MTDSLAVSVTLLPVSQLNSLLHLSLYLLLHLSFLLTISVSVNASVVVAEMHSVISWISSPTGKVTLVGHSLSSALASYYTVKYPSEVQRVILLTPIDSPANHSSEILNYRELSAIVGTTRIGSLLQWMVQSLSSHLQELGFPFPEAVQPQLLFHLNQQRGSSFFLFCSLAVYSAARREWDEFLLEWVEGATNATLPVGSFPVRVVTPVGADWDNWQTQSPFAKLSTNVQTIRFGDSLSEFPQRNPKETLSLLEPLLE